MKILFRTSGGRALKKQLGLGHIYRCINLAINLRPNKMYFLIEDYGGVKKILGESGFRNIFYLKKEIGVNSDIDETVRHIIRKKIDVLIIDKYCVTSKYLQEVRRFAKIVIISDLKKIDYSADLVINGFIGFDDKVIVNRYDSRCLVGPSYQILSDKFAKRTQHKKKYDLLATFGGFDEKNIVEILLKSITQYLQKLKTKIILGPVTKKSKRIRTLEKKYKKYLTIVDKARDMQKEISNTKYGICSGGLTTYEFAAMNIPFAIICQVRHQLTTAKEWQQRGVALNLGLVNNKTQEKIQEFVINILENKIPSQISNKLFVDGLGAKRVAHEILKIKN